MGKTRVYIENKSIDKLKKYYTQTIKNEVGEFDVTPNDSQLVEIALTELEVYKTGKEIEIKFSKKGKQLIIK